MDALPNLVKAEWSSLSAAPWSFALLVISAFGTAFAVCRWAYQSLHEAGKEKLEVLKERLAAKDDQLDEYRQRLGLSPSSGSKFSKLTHRELQEHALKFVEGVRAWFSQSEASTQRTADQHWNAMV